MRFAFALGASFLLLSGCATGLTEREPDATPTRTLGPGEQWVPFVKHREINGVMLDCGGTGWGGGHVLTGSPDDPRLVWMVVDGERHDLEWRVGYSARFTPELELLNQNGLVVGREGTELVGGCVMLPATESAPAIWYADVPCVSNDYRDTRGADPSVFFCGD